MLHAAQTALTYTLPFLCVLTFVITMHELGHFLVARLCGVAIDRFSIGFGKGLVSWHDKQGTEWRIAWIPLGGYVKFAGDENIASVPDAKDLAELRAAVLAREGPVALRRYFHFKPLWQRALITAAGPVANFILAVAIFTAVAMAVGDVRLTPRVGLVKANSPAAIAGFKTGDVVLSADGRPIDDFKQLSRMVMMRTGEPVHFEVERAGAPVRLVATPMRRPQAESGPDAPAGMGYLGLGWSQKKTDVQFVHFGPIDALRQGIDKTGEIVGMSVTYLQRMAAGRESGSQLGGILNMAGGTGQAASEATKQAPDLGSGALNLFFVMIQVAASISAAVGFANLLPIPVLDGGHLLFYAYEAVARRPLSANIQAAGYRVGFALLIGLMLFVTWNDLQRYQVFHLIGGLFS